MVVCVCVLLTVCVCVCVQYLTSKLRADHTDLPRFFYYTQMSIFLFGMVWGRESLIWFGVGGVRCLGGFLETASSIRSEDVPLTLMCLSCRLSLSLSLSTCLSEFITPLGGHPKLDCLCLVPLTKSFSAPHQTTWQQFNPSASVYRIWLTVCVWNRRVAIVFFVDVVVVLFSLVDGLFTSHRLTCLDLDLRVGNLLGSPFWSCYRIESAVEVTQFTC